MYLFRIIKRKDLLAWSLYDFANQPFSTIIVTFLYGAFFTKVIATDVETGTFLWSIAIAITAIVASFLSPILGAFADVSGYRKTLLIIFSWICILFSALLYFPNEGDIYFSLVFFVIANISFEISGVFYNSYLPGLVKKENIGKASGFSWGLGFIGGLLALLLSFILFEVDTSIGIKRTNILVAVWFAIFSLPTFILLQEKKKRTLNKRYLYTVFSNLYITCKNVSNYQNIVRFLIARLFYNDGLITIFALGGVYAVGSIGFDFKEVMLLAIILNICAALGSFLFGFLEDKIGVRIVINITLVVLIFATFLAYLSPSTGNPKEIFWISGILIGLMAGPNQSSSRSLMARLIPEKKANEFFGFFSLTGKATSFLGPLLFGVITSLHNQQTAILVVLFLFVIGLYIFNKYE